jgi:hypothetical protein
MADLNSPWAGDLQISATGDLATVDGDQRAEQRIIRRLFTNLGAYIWHPDYGASIPARIGSNLDVALFQAVVYSQIMLEDSVAQLPPPTVKVTQIGPDAVGCVIVYNAISDGLQKTLTFDYPPTSIGS